MRVKISEWDIKGLTIYEIWKFARQLTIEHFESQSQYPDFEHAPYAISGFPGFNRFDPESFSGKGLRKDESMAVIHFDDAWDGCGTVELVEFKGVNPLYDKDGNVAALQNADKVNATIHATEGMEDKTTELWARLVNRIKEIDGRRAKFYKTWELPKPKPPSAITRENILHKREIFKGDPKTFRSIIKAYKKTLGDDSGRFRLLGEDDDNYQRIEINSHFRVSDLIASIPPTREEERERALPYGSCVLSAQVTPQRESQLKIEGVYRDWHLVEPRVSRLLEYLQAEDWLRGKGISVGDVLAQYEKMTPEEEEKINRDFLQSLRPSPIALAMADDSGKRRREIEAQEAMIKIAEMLDKQIRYALSNKEKPTEQEPEEDTPTWANEAWYTALTIDERQRYHWLRPYKERWEMGEVTDNELASELGKSVDTIRRWRRDLEKKNCPDMDWQRPT